MDSFLELMDSMATVINELKAYRASGLTPEQVQKLAQAQNEGRLAIIDERFALAMRAGARAIDNNGRLQGKIFIYDIFGKNTKELSYFEASNILRKAAEKALKERE